MTRKEQLIDTFEKAIDRGARYIGVLIEVPNIEYPELIITPRSNFENRLEAYKEAFNDDLIANQDSLIRIVEFTYEYGLEDVERVLL